MADAWWNLLLVVVIAVACLGMCAAFHVGREIGREDERREARMRAAGKVKHGLRVLRARG